MKKYLSLILVCLVFHANSQQTVSLISTDAPPLKFASAKISKSLVQRGFKVDASLLLGKNKKDRKLQIIIATSNDKVFLSSVTKSSISFPEKLESEGFSIQTISNKEIKTVFVLGHDEAGAMYGGLELAEVIRSEEHTSELQ